MPYITYNKPIEYHYNNNDYDDFDYEEEEIEFEVTWKQLMEDEDIKQQYALEFSYKYEMDFTNAKKLLDDYAIWYEDEEINKYVLENNTKELYERYYKED